jgi:hypothetical protein
VEEKLLPLFGGWWGYQAAPADKVLKHRLRIYGLWQAEHEENEEK